MSYVSIGALRMAALSPTISNNLTPIQVSELKTQVVPLSVDEPVPAKVASPISTSPVAPIPVPTAPRRRPSPVRTPTAPVTDATVVKEIVVGGEKKKFPWLWVGVGVTAFLILRKK